MADALTEEQVQGELTAIAKAALADPAAKAAEAAQAQDAEKAKAEADAKAKADADAAAGKDEGDEGEKDGDDDIPYKNAADRRNFRALRDAAKALQASADREKERADRAEKELQALRSPPKKHPLEEKIEKLSPEARQRMEADGTLDLLLASVEAAKKVENLDKTVEEMRKEREARERAERAEKNYLASLDRYGKDNKLPKDLLNEMDALIDAGKVGGDTAQELFDNAREYAELKRGSGKGGGDADKAAAAARKAAASGADASAGAAAGSPGSTKKQLSDKYEELLKTDPAEADRVLVAAMTNPEHLPRLSLRAPAR